MLKGINWIIIGGESNQGQLIGRDFHAEWIRSLIPICRDMGIALFVKQMGTNAYQSGKKMVLNDHHGGDWTEWPEDLRIRQMPFNAN